MALSPEAQHVIDSLEAHLGAVKTAAASGSPAAIKQAGDFGDAALKAIAVFGGTVRGAAQPAAAEAAAAVAAGSKAG